MIKNIQIKRIYENYNESDGFRVLVDGLWPRGKKKEDVKIDLWMKEIAPSTELRKWYHQNLNEWEEFCLRYKNELNDKKELCAELLNKPGSKITLLFSAKDLEHNHAIILKQFLNEQLV